MRVMENDMCNEVNSDNVEYFDYSPFGEVLTKGEDKKPGKVGFIGKEQDEESSYFQLGVRQYDPAIIKSVIQIKKVRFKMECFI